MLKKFLFSSVLILTLSFLSSCNKWLDLKPLDGITRDEFWKTKEDINVALVACYSSLLQTPPGVARDKPVTESIFLWGELRGDMLQSTVNTELDLKDVMNVNILSTNIISDWSAFYRTINYCNLVLDYGPAVLQSDATLTEEQLNIYLGEALTLRSLMYFYLARTFGDVPLKLKSSSKDTDIKDIGKAAQSDILNQITEDLKQAQEWLPNQYSAVRVTKGRVTKLAATALLADVYLWLDQYANCIAECNKIISYSNQNSSQLSLIRSVLWWETVFNIGSSRETIFELSNSSSGAPANAFRELLVNRPKFLASSYVLDEVFPEDDNPNLFDYRSGPTFTAAGTVIKYGEENPSYVNFQVYRYSEIMLMKAEALAASNSNGAEALALIEELRQARRAAPITHQDHTADDYDGIVDYVLAERSREFAFEGKRWFDLLRVAKRDNYRRIDILSSAVARSVPADAAQIAITKLKDVNSHYLPINQADLFADLTLIQNPFYAK